MTTDNDQVKYDYIAALREDRVNNMPANERPLYNQTASDDEIIRRVGKLAEFFLANSEKVTDSERAFCESVVDRLRWANNRFHIYEHALLGLSVGRTTNVELAQLLDGRSDVLYSLFGRDRSQLSNEQILEHIKQSNNPLVTGGLHFDMYRHQTVIHYPSLIKEFLDAVDKWQDDREAAGRLNPMTEPEMLLIVSPPAPEDEGKKEVGVRPTWRDGRNPAPAVRRFIRREWLDWYGLTHSLSGRGRSFEEATQAAIDILVKQLFPEGKPVDVQVDFDPYSREQNGHEIIIRRVRHNVEYF